MYKLINNLVKFNKYFFLLWKNYKGVFFFLWPSGIQREKKIMKIIIKMSNFIMCQTISVYKLTYSNYPFLGKIEITVFSFFTSIFMIVKQYIETVFCFQLITDKIPPFPIKINEIKFYFQAIIKNLMLFLKKNT